MNGDGAARRIWVEKPADLARVLDVLRDQEFERPRVVHDRRRRAVTIPFTLQFGRDRGEWTLEILRVNSWLASSTSAQDRDVLKDIRYDRKAGTLTVLTLLDTLVADVDALDVRVGLAGAADRAAGVTAADLPDAFRREMQAKRAAQQREYDGVAERRVRLARKAAIAATIVSVGFVLLAGGPLLLLLLGCPVLSGGAAWALVRFRLPPFAGMLLMGAVGFALIGAAVNQNVGGVALVGPLIHVLFGGLCHIAFGGLLVHWMREEASVRR